MKQTEFLTILFSKMLENTCSNFVFFCEEVERRYSSRGKGWKKWLEKKHPAVYRKYTYARKIRSLTDEIILKEGEDRNFQSFYMGFKEDCIQQEREDLSIKEKV